MNPGDLLYQYEHVIIPGLFYKHGAAFLQIALTRQDEALFGMLEALFKETKTENPYRREDFKAELYESSDEYTSVKIRYPNPERDPLCYCCYLFADSEGEKLRCYTVEKDTFEDEENKMLCAWSQEHRHSNYGLCSSEDYADYKKCVELFLFD